MKQDEKTWPSVVYASVYDWLWKKENDNLVFRKRGYSNLILLGLSCRYRHSSAKLPVEGLLQVQFAGSLHDFRQYLP